MRYQLYKLFNYSVGLIPVPLLRHLLRALHRHPQYAERAGYQVYPQTYYNPFPVPAAVDVAKLDLPRSLPAIDLRIADALQLLGEFTRFSAEARQFIANRTGNLHRWDNTYPPCDSSTLFALLRHLKPRHYIEVGCGFSSQASVAALRLNAAEGRPCESTFIEPYPPPYLSEMNLPGQFIKKRIEQVPLEFFQQLEAGDVLFIDTSHVIKVQNDVEYELLRLLPSLKAGVIVHIHDIFTPYDYPAEWLIGDGPNRGGNNEQYALECLLSGGADWEVFFPLHHLWREHREALQPFIFGEDRPAAFWIRKAAPPKL